MAWCERNEGKQNGDRKRKRSAFEETVGEQDAGRFRKQKSFLEIPTRNIGSATTSLENVVDLTSDDKEQRPDIPPNRYRGEFPRQDFQPIAPATQRTTPVQRHGRFHPPPDSWNSRKQPKPSKEIHSLQSLDYSTYSQQFPAPVAYPSLVAYEVPPTFSRYPAPASVRHFGSSPNFPLPNTQTINAARTTAPEIVTVDNKVKTFHEVASNPLKKIHEAPKSTMTSKLTNMAPRLLTIPSSQERSPSSEIPAELGNQAPGLLNKPNSEAWASSSPYLEPPSSSPAVPAKKEKAASEKPKKSRAKKPKTEPELCQEQQDLVNLILSGRNVFYTGSAGCGKSTVLKAFVKQLRAKGKKVIIVAPTGRAALEVNGSTYFTFAGWTPDHFKKPIKKLRQAAHGRFVRKRMMEVDVLVIDEISMMENYAFERLNEVMQEARSREAAFGGVQLVVTGDYCQLPPVKPFKFCITCGREMIEKMAGTIFKCPQHGEVPEIDKWAFQSYAWKKAEFEHVNLTTIHRQRDRNFIGILEKLRMGKLLDEKDSDLLLNHKCNVKNAVKLYPTREEVRRVNNNEFIRLLSEQRNFKCYDHFQHNPMHHNLEFKKARNQDGSLQALREHRFDPEIELKEGMLVILLVNLNIDEGLVNGSQGIVTGWEPYEQGKMPMCIDRSASKSKGTRPTNVINGTYASLREANIKAFIDQAPRKEWPIVTFDNGVVRTIFADCVVNELGDETPSYSLLSRTQIPLLAGWAMTVHKSQGMTLNRVQVDLTRSFEEGQMYVALSRARSLQGLKIDGLGHFRGGGNEQVMQFLLEKFGVK